MTFREDHEIHQRRFGRNLGVGLALAVFVAVVFGLTLAKVSGGGNIQGYDHSVRPALLPAEGE
ncbi:UPF0716 family protein affecting phage T7 exclusion [Rhodovulum iodosum]|uniref:UPF0716 family protein affecting phage T7 exclusion n=1 Tax=Rhodovulum iodosum TaxID=68291 RepID=A0ABV3XW87_9RHOB|nr:hypothetical protein [Rhodovulum robiginosum]RSK36750.1 hypothetical protein EJA01_04440 [Rhodovulum robiginosum]